MDDATDNLSSLWTLFYKFLFPTLWIGGFAFGTGTVWLTGGGGQDAMPAAVKVGMTAALFGGTAFIYWSCCRLKRVRMDAHFLYISNYFQEIQVPVEQVERVTEWKWDNTHPVTIHFIRPTEFGSAITFMPKMRMFGLWSSHPVVEQILTAADPGRLRRP